MNADNLSSFLFSLWLVIHIDCSHHSQPLPLVFRLQKEDQAQLYRLITVSVKGDYVNEAQDMNTHKYSHSLVEWFGIHTFVTIKCFAEITPFHCKN